MKTFSEELEASLVRTIKTLMESAETPTHPELHKVLTDAGWKHTGNRPHMGFGKPVSKPHSWYDSPKHHGVSISVGKSGKWARHGSDKNGGMFKQGDEGVTSLKRELGTSK